MNILILLQDVSMNVYPAEKSAIKKWLPIISALVSFGLGLLVLPFIKARGEHKRLLQLKQTLIQWLTRINEGLTEQTLALNWTIAFLKFQVKSYNFATTAIPVEHLLQFPDSDLRKVMFEKLKENGNVEDYIFIVGNLHLCKKMGGFLQPKAEQLMESLKKLKAERIKETMLQFKPYLILLKNGMVVLICQ